MATRNEYLYQDPSPIHNTKTRTPYIVRVRCSVTVAPRRFRKPRILAVLRISRRDGIISTWRVQT